ncbi:MAG: class I SAM-dependent methyltransferase [Isosphaeraceae bacterium]
MRRPHHFIAEPPGARVQNGSAVEEEYRVLTTDAGRRLLTEVASVRSIRPADLVRFRKQAAPEAVAAAVRLAMARRKAAEKFERGDRMWVEAIGVEQSTAEPVARHKAERFATSPIVVDLCAGIGGDAIAMAAHSRVLAVDLDPGMCRRVAWNAEVYDVGERVLAVRALAETFAIPRGAWVHLDPDRRAIGDRRARALEDYAPGPSVWESIVRRVPAGAIKLSPAADFARHFPGPGFEVELISLRGECKEATVWFGEAACCRRRATRLPEGVTWTDRDAGAGSGDPRPTLAGAGSGDPRPTLAGVSPLSSWIYDPDPSLIRAGLLDGFARAHGISRVSEGVDYLTSADPIETPFLAAFAVRDVCSMDLKHLRRMIERHRVGTLEIKVRGVDLTPEALRARLKPRGEESATLLIVGGTGPARAVLARRGSR